MEIVSFRIRTQVAYSPSYSDNRYTHSVFWFPFFKKSFLIVSILIMNHYLRKKINV